MNKVVKTAAALIALTSVFSFAQGGAPMYAPAPEYAPAPVYAPAPAPVYAPAPAPVPVQASGEGFKMGFYGAIAATGSGISSFKPSSTGELVPSKGITQSIGMLFNLGSGLEFGLGVGIGSGSRTIEEAPGDGSKTITDEYSVFLWEFIPSVSYQLGKKDFIDYGAGLNIHLSSWSYTFPEGNSSVTISPKSMEMAFFPNFYIKAEVVKNFAVGLKTGFMIDLLKDEYVDDLSNDKTTTSITWIDTRTEVFVSFYL